MHFNTATSKMCYLKTNLIFLFCVHFLNIVSEAGPLKWPSRFSRCYRDDPKLNKCILEATSKMKPFLAAGIPEFHLPKISPFHVPEVQIDQGGGAVTYSLKLTNVVIRGFDSYEFEKFDFDPKRLQFDAKLKMGILDFKTDYISKGKLLTVPIEGNGTLSFKVLTSEGTLKQGGKLVTKKGITYLDVDPPVIFISVGEVVDTKSIGLFEGNEVFAKAAQKVFQDHQREIVEEMKPAVEKVIAEIVYDIQKKFWRFPYDEAFPVHK